jgi:hypothetical protein
MNPPWYAALPARRRSIFSSGVSGHVNPIVTIAAAQTTAGTWTRTSPGHRHASSPPAATKTMNARWTTTTKSASTR